MKRAFKEILNYTLLCTSIVSSRAWCAEMASEKKVEALSQKAIVQNGLLVVEGDMLIELQRGLAVTKPSAKWPQKHVPFAIAKNISHDLKKEILNAIQKLNGVSPVQFLPKKNAEKDYVLFQMWANQSMCYSMIGRRGGVQPIYLAPGGCGESTLLHEMGHTLGLLHEHTRCDRDQYIIVDFAAILSGYAPQFAKNCTGASALGPYDKQSLMHYSNYAFAKDIWMPTLTSKVEVYEILGSDTFSELDLRALNTMYP